MMESCETVMSGNPAETEACGEALAQRIEPGDLILLEGDLAAGKTTFVRGLLRGLGGDPSDSNSPTFVVVQTYPCSGRFTALHHIDLYRLADEADALREIGLQEFLADDQAVVAVEWPRPALQQFVGPGIAQWHVSLLRQADDSRKIEIRRR